MNKTSQFQGEASQIENTKNKITEITENKTYPPVIFGTANAEHWAQFFGTKRSQVQILSPRPAKRPISCEIWSFFITFYTSESLPPGAILIHLVQNRPFGKPVGNSIAF